jgi:hypothetical protein
MPNFNALDTNAASESRIVAILSCGIRGFKKGLGGKGHSGGFELRAYA